MATVKITLVKSTIGCKEPQRRTVRALGISKLNQTVVRTANEAVMGMIRSVEHLVHVETTPDKGKKA